MRTVDAAGLGIGDEYPPRIMGVLNVSEESPYDPSVFADPGEAAAYVDDELVGEGADIVDVGLESANKRFEVLAADEELDRLDTAVETLESTSGDAVWSIETRYHEVAEAALDRGFEMVNDICGFADPEMPRVCEEYDVAVSKMASPPDLERPGAVERPDDIYEALELNGFTDKTIVDPAFGGWSEDKTVGDDRETFRRLREFRGYGRPMLVSINRKNFLRTIAGRDTEGALPVSLAATAMAVERGAHVIRTHDVAETRDAALVGEQFRPERVRDRAAGVEELDVTADREFSRHLERVGGDGGESVVTHAVELGLPAEAAEYVARRAERAGIGVYGDETLLLVGTAAEFRSLRAETKAGPDAAVRAVESVCSGLE
jgi:dihydropteroate synthase